MNPSEIQVSEQIWGSLKIVIIIIAALGPIVIAFLAIRCNRTIKRLKKEHQTNQKLYEKRIDIYDRIGPKLNDLLCFYCYTGNWKELAPMDIVGIKKELDKDINVYGPIFSEDLVKKYLGFIHLCFVSFSGWEHKEKIKSLYELRQEHIAEWNDDWIPFFDTNNVVEAPRLKAHYDELIECFKKELSGAS
jgi:hypothetical protein